MSLSYMYFLERVLSTLHTTNNEQKIKKINQYDFFGKTKT